MSNSDFIEAFSPDPFVRDIHRRAMRVLNDSTLGRHQRELHIRKLQQILIEHQEKLAFQDKIRAKNPSRKTLSKNKNR